MRLSAPVWLRSCVAMPCMVDRPSPVPLPLSFVVKNGSNPCAAIDSSMPDPVSATVSRM
jgi:hypothetical protein